MFSVFVWPDINTRDEVEGLYNRREFSQTLECLYQAMDLAYANTGGKVFFFFLN